MQRAGLGRCVLGLALAACSAPPTQAKASALAPASYPDRAAAFPTGECAHLLTALGPAQRLAASAVDGTTPEPTLRELLGQSEAAADALERERNALTSPVLANELNHSMLAMAYLSHGLAELLGLQHLRQKDLAAQERALYVARRQLEVTTLAARARCEEEPSREQSAAWRVAALQSLSELAPTLRACADAQRDRSPVARSAGVTVAIHVAADGYVSLAGPLQFNVLSDLSADFVFCALRGIEAAHFAAPRDAAILHLPLAVESAQTGPGQ